LVDLDLFPFQKQDPEMNLDPTIAEDALKEISDKEEAPPFEIIFFHSGCGCVHACAHTCWLQSFFFAVP
jgi:hypothetical protein